MEEGSEGEMVGELVNERWREKDILLSPRMLILTLCVSLTLTVILTLPPYLYLTPIKLTAGGRGLARRGLQFYAPPSAGPHHHRPPAAGLRSHCGGHRIPAQVTSQPGSRSD